MWYHSYTKHMIPRQESVASPRDERGGCPWLLERETRKGSETRTRQFTFNIDAVRIPYGNHTLKYPEHPQAASSQYGRGHPHLWQPHPHGAKPRDVLEIPTTCNGMHEKTPHPTQKPEELLRKIVLASSNPGDLILDPFIGSGTTAVVAEQLKRRWKGCDISVEYCRWAVERLELVEDWPIERWILYDQENARRRQSIRYF
ncbi:restriction endonuclease subunit M [Thermogemmatispora tikiterensis]|uniref:Methyltransferase n=1 Tax=Thermogemmatispora tikiterensis TaxID=1825093 RepID=A0A328VEM6_9CHLR|nr:restriction endonuclease subunit M [Thermogemmatispora tikiterensis]